MSINDPYKIRAQKRNQKKTQRKRKRNNEIEADVARKTRKTQLDKLIEEGYKDLRNFGKKCPTCSKLYVKAEELMSYTMLKDDVTPCGYTYDKGSKRIYWSYCLLCKRKTLNANYIEGKKQFDGNQIVTLQRHLNMTRENIRIAMNQLRKQFDGKCAACGIETIQKGKSGWKQQSFTDMYPKRRYTDNPSCEVEDIRMVCLACQYFQDTLNWNELFNALCEIQNAEQKTKNLSPLNDNELSYLNSIRGGRTKKFKHKLFDRDGRHCQYTGVEMKFEPYHWNTMSFDRFNSQQLYTIENTHLVCKNINFVKKRTITEEELLAWLKHIRSPNFVFQHDARQVQ